MTAVRLHIDGQGVAWALVRCDRCHETHRFPVTAAARMPVTCDCGHLLDVRASVDADAQARMHADLGVPAPRADADDAVLATAGKDAPG